MQNGQVRVPVLSLPFRFALAENDPAELGEFWTDLRRADLLFERDRIPPSAWICDSRYYFADRRGDRHRHFVHLPGCKPLNRRISPQEAEERAAVARHRIASLSRAETFLNPAEKAAHACNPRSAKCGLLRVAVKSICSKKYARCRIARAAHTRGGRRIAGRQPGRIRSASLSARHHHRR
jgi:hypothetical protein